MLRSIQPFVLGATLLSAIVTLVAVPSPARAADDDLAVTVSRPLRYRFDGTDFVIDDGQNWFNRPLYGPNTSFRIDGGDKPEFALLDPNWRDGVLRLGVKTGRGAIWLTDAQHITTRYRAGSLIYEIRDSLLGDATLDVTVLSLSDSDGLILRAELSSGAKVPDAELAWALGGMMAVTGGSIRQIDENRGSDLRPRLTLDPTQCAANIVSASGGGFQLRSGVESLAGVASSGSVIVGDASKMSSIASLLAAAATTNSAGAAAAIRLPILFGRSSLSAPVYLAISRASGKGVSPRPAPSADELGARFDASEARRQSIAGTLRIDTPDPFINAIPAAMAIAADGCWEPPQWMHGAVSWRTPLLGWRGSYAADALGWHDRAVAFYKYWAARQNTKPEFPTVAVPDPVRLLAENDGVMLHSNGDIPQSHYDMDLVFIDSLLRHLLWTGDLGFARQMWPVIQRHLAWEKRLFDRDGLYEAYAAIWASDALEYNGGGSSHGSAYNLYHNRMAARIARLIGEDPTRYENEAKRIDAALQSRLWLRDRGWYAEYQDVMGEKLIHPAAALWTIYHAIDSQVPDPLAAWQCIRYVDTQIARIPLRGPNYPPGNYYVLPTSNWMPYMWSLNNVVTGEDTHMALACFQAGRSDEGFTLLKSMMLDTMFAGMTPGNIPNLSSFDPYRGESYTDFDDPIGITSRCVVEGLLGIRPDALAGELLIRPGFPMEWDHASVDAHDLSYRFALRNQTENWSVESRFDRPMRLKLQVPARADGIAAVQINGQPVTWSVVDHSVGQPWVEIDSPAAAAKYDVTIVWSGQPLAHAQTPEVVAQGGLFRSTFAPAILLDVTDPQKTLANVAPTFEGLSALAVGTMGHRTAFAHVKQGEMTWRLPIEFEIRPAFELEPSAVQTKDGLSYRIRNNTNIAISGPVTCTYGVGKVTSPFFQVPPMSRSFEGILPALYGLSAPGLTTIEVDLGGGRSCRGDIVNWQLPPLPATAIEPVDMSKSFNDRVTQIFRNDYVSPRPQTCSLQIPLHGTADWTGPAKVFNVDDRGLRQAATKTGKITLPQGMSFLTPSAPDAKNIAFTSQWDNYPRTITVGLEGRAGHIWFLLAGSTTPMQSRLENGELTVKYTDGTTAHLALNNPTNWWPIEQDYRIDDYAFRRPEPIPLRVELGTGTVYTPEKSGTPRGGAATVLDLPLDRDKSLQSVTLHTEAYEIVMGLMAVTLER
jgi:hypothetical protein